MTRRRSTPQPIFDPHGSLGLNLLSCPPDDPLLDLIFVHGLGGASVKTWCRSEDATLFWPKAWLPREAGFRNIRIHSYGYDADWKSSRATPTINIHDFGQQLLERLRSSSEIARPRTSRIVFVAHSMGGLVVKQAYVLARQDPSFHDLAMRMEAMLFLGTPHRGSNLAQTLNSMLHATATLSPRSYISNLSQQNELLSMLNDSFRHYASDVSLYSFYESRATEIYVRSEVIVPKDSAVMGFPHERHAMLDADHKSICKFHSPSDPNYTTILDALRSMTETILERFSSRNVEETWRAMQQIESYLAMPARPDEDLNDVEEARIDGSCEWFAERDTFQRWIDPASGDPSSVYWVSANPATGKSVLSGYVVNALTNLSLDCSYYFFRHGDKDKSTMSGYLRSLLYQMAFRSADVRQQLMSMVEKAVRFNKDDHKAIWRKLVWPIMCQTGSTSVHYWVLDALDECAGLEDIFWMLASLERHPCIRILITSRKLPEIKQQFTNLQQRQDAVAIYVEEISLEDTKVDIRLYLEANQYKFHVGDQSQKNTFSNHILNKSDGCFLWVRLVLDELQTAWAISDAQRVLDEVPQEMDLLYSRALKIMASKPKSNRDLIRAILTWIICSVRPMTVSELRDALKLDLEADIPELEMAIASLCAQLVHVDKTGRVMIVHLTAKTFLIDGQLDSEFRVNEKLGHLHLATSCLRFLCSDQMKVPRGRRPSRKHSQAQARPLFARYACLDFAEHLRHTTSVSLAVSNYLYKFLGANVLSWIEFVAASGNLSVLTRTANSINAYLQRHIRSSSPLGDFVHLTQNWVVDLHRIVTGFGANLLLHPSAIYWLIPPFCPKMSAIVATTRSQFKRITVTGLKNENWNDRMSCIDGGENVSAVACGDSVFAVGYYSGSVVLHHSNTCLPWKALHHGSIVRHLLFGGTGAHLLCAGRRDIKLWDIDTGFVLWIRELSHDVMSLDITEDGRFAMTTEKSSTFKVWNIQSGRLERTVSWGEKTLFPDEGGFRRPPLTAALSPDAWLVAIAYRGRPICLYDLDDDVIHGFVSRDGDPTQHGLGANTSPYSLVFNTRRDSPTLVAAYEDGDLCLFDYEDLKLLRTIEETAHIVACSPDGLTLVTGNSHGMVQLMEFDTLQLLYRVNAADYGIRDLSFSADNLRFLDVRGTQCNVWEPAVLSGMAKRDEASTEPAEWQPIIKGIDNDDMGITSIEIGGSGRHFFVGRSDGSLSLYETTSGEQRKVLYRHNYQISVTCTIWGPHKRLVATSDTACRFIVCVLVPDEEVGWKVAVKLMDQRADSGVLQLLLDPSDSLLLVSTEKSNTVWDLKTRNLVSTQTWQPSSSFSWVNHPTSPAHRILVTASAVHVFEWKSSIESRPAMLFQVSESHTSDRVQGVKNAFTLTQGSLLVVEFSQLYEERSTTEIMVFELFPADSVDLFVTPVSRFNELGQKIRHVIGGYGPKLLFVDLNRWVCSIDSNQGDCKFYLRHFPIPSDWQSQQRRLQMSVTQHGDILFVRMNEVAVISQGLDFEERVQVEPGQ
ncbi:hypothetical protein BFJ68_g16634 [Fusarium oxysporum]|uniref:Uncharacterized protein n=1 Tax=Fusarium oxysporum TaxID=5507 RepID=A0A420PB75_FUSOX|nr:hypothetical protein BFJ68_g16634 [Fusarium oxysporum]